MHRFLTRSEAGSDSLVRFLKKPPFSFDEVSVASGDGTTMDVSNRSALTDCTDIVFENKASFVEMPSSPFRGRMNSLKEEERGQIESLSYQPPTGIS